MKKIDRRRGVTLIALVVTIVILLIVASVSIVTLTGENSIIKQSIGAKDATDLATEKEAIELDILNEGITKEETDYIGEKLYDRNITNGNKWKIIMLKNSKEVFGTNWRYIPVGTDIDQYGKTKFAWVYDEDTSQAKVLEQDGFMELGYGMNLAVKDNIVLNLDPINMENEETWGDVNLYGFNGVEKDENGNVISGFSGNSFNFDGVDDYIEIYTDESFTDEGITIETYGKLDDRSRGIGNIYKGPVEGSVYAFKYSVGNRACVCTPIKYFQLTGTFVQGIPTGGKYECSGAANDWSIHLEEHEQEGEEYVTYSLKNNGEFFVMRNGEVVARDKFSDEYVKNYKKYLANKNYPITIGKGAHGYEINYMAIETYATRLYSRALTEEEAKENQEKTIAYHEIMSK